MWNTNVLKSYLILQFLPCPPFPLVPAISIFVSPFTAKPLERAALLCPTYQTSFYFLISSDVHFHLSTESTFTKVTDELETAKSNDPFVSSPLCFPCITCH